jgi:tRNA threonylcarbamoyladenosine biosynthesis protein TsaB
MLILALDTSGYAGSVALLEGAAVLIEEVLDPVRRSAQTLAPAIAGLLAAQRISAAAIDLVATTVGPGSFTGLRVGVTTAKTFAYAAGAELIGLSTLEVLAAQVPPEMRAGQAAEIHAVLDAQRKELFHGRFAGCGLEISRVAPDVIISAEAWLESLPTRSLVTGTGLDKILERMPAGVIVAPPPLREPRAATVGRLAWREYQGGRRDDLWKLAPVYLRPSYAEEKAARK